MMIRKWFHWGKKREDTVPIVLDRDKVIERLYWSMHRNNPSNFDKVLMNILEKYGQDSKEQ